MRWSTVRIGAMRKYLHFKRFRMEADLRAEPAALPDGFVWEPWRDSLLHAHAEVKAACFQDETDSLIFPCLASLDGCRDLMRAIRERPGFCPHATWLVTADGIAVATIQGVIDSNGIGGIQNVGVVSECRGRGLGRALVMQAFTGFIACGVRRAYLEVTASNRAAMRLYRSLGFRCTKTVYRSVPAPDPVAVGI
jgi:ribosomal protein S18 acetylase RimI-like enzyme